MKILTRSWIRNFIFEVLLKTAKHKKRNVAGKLVENSNAISVQVREVILGFVGYLIMKIDLGYSAWTETFDSA